MTALPPSSSVPRLSQPTATARPGSTVPLLLSSLPLDLLAHVLASCADGPDGLPTIGRLARAAHLFLTLFLEEDAPWSSVFLPTGAVPAFTNRSFGEHTSVLRIRLPPRSQHRPTFCKFVHHPLGKPCAPCHPLASTCGSLLDAGTRALVRACPRLRELHLPGMGHLTVSSLIAALEGLPTLEVLSLRGCEAVTSGFAAAVAGRSGEECCAPQLRQLDLSHVCEASDNDVSALLARLPSLEGLLLNFCPQLTDVVLDELPPQLERLDAVGCPRLSYSRLEALAQELGTDALGGSRLACDDSLVLSLRAGSGSGPDMARSLLDMLMDYRREESRWAESTL